MDAISRLLVSYFDWAGALAPLHFSFLLRALLLLGLPCLFCAWALASGSRTILVQCLWFTVGLLLSSMIPVEKWEITNRHLRGWLLLCGIVLLAFLPGILASLVVDTVGAQRKARMLAYLTMLALLLGNLVLAWRHR